MMKRFQYLDITNLTPSEGLDLFDFFAGDFVIAISLLIAVFGAFGYQHKMMTKFQYKNIDSFMVAEQRLFGSIIFNAIVVTFLVYYLHWSTLNQEFTLSVNGILFKTSPVIYLTKLFILGVIFCSIPFLHSALMVERVKVYAFYFFLLMITFSVSLLLNANDFMIVFLLLEIQSLSSYVLAIANTAKPGLDDDRSYRSSFFTEAGSIYFLCGSYVTAVFLFGLSLIYLATGSVSFQYISELIPAMSQVNQLILALGLILVSSAILFKLGCYPLHSWVVDVYDGAPLATTLVFNIVPKLPLVSLFYDLASMTSKIRPEINMVYMLMGVMTIFISVFYAFAQVRVKRLLIYSSISQVGFVVAACSFFASTYFNFEGKLAVLFFLVIYVLIVALGWFLLVTAIKANASESHFLDESHSSFYIGNIPQFLRSTSAWAIAITAVSFSMAGIPPFAGFFSKFVIVNEFVQAMDSTNDVLILSLVALILVLFSVAVYYYIRVIKVMLFKNKESKVVVKDFITQEEIFTPYVLSTFVFLLVVLGFKYDSLLLLIFSHV